MDTSKLTQKSLEALQRAQSLAVRHGHPAVDGDHVLAALVQDPEGIVPRLVARTPVRPDVLAGRVEAALARKPKVSGPGHDAAGVGFTRSLSALLDRAGEHATRLKD